MEHLVANTKNNPEQTAFYYFIKSETKGDLRGKKEDAHHRLKGQLGRPFTNPRINKAILRKLRENVPRDASKDRGK